jgi:hypothetical protein
MAVPGAAALLDVWERGLDRPPVWRALALLAASAPGSTPEDLAALPLGERNTALLALRESLFGPRIEAVAQCPGCAERVELSFSATEMLGGIRAPSGRPGHLRRGGYVLDLRAVTSADLLAMTGQPGTGHPELEIASRCIVAASRASAPTATVDVPAEVLAGLDEELAALDPAAGLELSIDCPACGQSWLSPFNVVAFLWAELHSWARRTLRDVHDLARAYGWCEADLLAMNPHRRREYLELVRS